MWPLSASTNILWLLLPLLIGLASGWWAWRGRGSLFAAARPVADQTVAAPPPATPPVPFATLDLDRFEPLPPEPAARTWAEPERAPGAAAIDRAREEAAASPPPSPIVWKPTISAPITPVPVPSDDPAGPPSVATSAAYSMPDADVADPPSSAIGLGEPSEAPTYAPTGSPEDAAAMDDEATVPEPASAAKPPALTPVASEQEIAEASSAPTPAIAASIASPAEEPAATAGDAPRPDDLTRMRGVNAALATSLADLGITRFAQIAALTPAQKTRLDAQLGRYPGRIDDEEWAEQARMLAAGDEDGFVGRFGAR